MRGIKEYTLKVNLSLLSVYVCTFYTQEYMKNWNSMKLTI
jgi:hypothetical protein